MKRILTTHKNIPYEFRFLERTRTVQIIKADVITYQIKWSVSLFICSCPGSRFYKKCWHLEMIPILKSLPSVTEPWAEWAEEAEEMNN